MLVLFNFSVYLHVVLKSLNELCQLNGSSLFAASHHHNVTRKQPAHTWENVRWAQKKTNQKQVLPNEYANEPSKNTLIPLRPSYLIFKRSTDHQELWTLDTLLRSKDRSTIQFMVLKGPLLGLTLMTFIFWRRFHVHLLLYFFLFTFFLQI